MVPPANITHEQILEINLISAQGLKSPSLSPRRNLQTYALTWIDPSTKLRTRVDKVGGHNPTWNDKFLFRVTPEFLSGNTSAVTVVIYAIGTFRDHIIGSLRVLVGNLLSSDADGTPCFSAFQIRRPSGRFYGVLNIGAMLIETSDFPALSNSKISAIGYRDLMGDKIRNAPRKTMSLQELNSGSSESLDNCSSESADGGDSSTSSSSPPPLKAAPLKDWKGVTELAGNNYVPDSKFYKVEAILRPWRIPLVSSALLKMGIRGVTVSDVRGFGAQGGSKERHGGSEFSEDSFVAKVKMEIVVKKDQVEDVVDTIIKEGRTGEIGDGKIFLIPVSDVIRVRTGERGEQAERMTGGRTDMTSVV